MLSQRPYEYEERLYFKETPTEQEVLDLARRLPGGARELLSTRSRRYREIGLQLDALSDAEVVDWLVREPGLWKRPVIVLGDRVLVQPTMAEMENL